MDYLCLIYKRYQMNLREYIRKHRNPEQLKLIMLQIIQGINELHSLSYVHRDLKPDNIVVNLIPLEVRIIDFDRACLTTDTQKCSALGTPGYFPEAHNW